MVEKKAANPGDKIIKLLLFSKERVIIILINQKYEATLCL